MSLDRPRVSVIVCTYDERRLKDLDDCIRSLLAQEFNDFEVIIVVDHNEGLYRALIDRYKDHRVRVVLNNSEVGQAASMNYGILNAKGEIVCFIDDDAYADENYLSEHLKVYSSNDVYAVAGRIEPLWLCRKPDYLIEELYWLIGATGNYLPQKVVEIRNAWSGNCSFRREVFSKVGLFSVSLGKANSRLFQGEDAEFGLRCLLKLGKGVVYNPNAVIYHKVYPERVRMRNLLTRAFEQGYAKAFIFKHKSGGSLSVEKGYLKILLSKVIFTYIKQALTGPQRVKGLKSVTFALLITLVVSIGFVAGLFWE